MYYKTVGEQNNSYARLVFLNELFTGQSQDYVLDLVVKENEEKIRIDTGNYNVCLLGLPKRIYNKQYCVDTNSYMRIYVQFERTVISYFTKNSIVGEIALFLYNDKYIVVLFSLTKGSKISESKVVRFLQDNLQKLYEDSFLKDKRYCNRTYYKLNVTGINNLSLAIDALLKTSEKSFFDQTPKTVNVDIKIQEYSKYSRQQVQYHIDELSDLVYQKNNKKINEWMNLIFKEYLKNAQDFVSLSDCLVGIKNTYYKFSHIYRYENETFNDDFFNYRKYASIEELEHSIRFLLKEMVEVLTQKQRIYSKSIQSVLQIVNEKFYLYEISLDYVAQKLGMSSSYLSTLFKRETGINFASYLLDLRIEHAKKLLASSNYYVKEVSQRCGFDNCTYFSQVFRKKLSMTPIEYRENTKYNG